jgi:hypothetical protein
MAKIGWNINYGARHFVGSDVSPLSIIAFGPIPMFLRRTIPVTLVEENIHIHVRGVVDIGLGDDEHRGWRRNHKRRGWRDVDPDIDVYSRRASV